MIRPLPTFVMLCSTNFDLPQGGGYALPRCALLTFEVANPYMASAPRPIAATPVRHTSTRPIGCMMAMNCSIFDVRPVS
jgi:hypothetical protein